MIHSGKGKGLTPSLGLVFLCLILGGIGVLYYDILYSLIRVWNDDPDYSHGFLVPLVSAFFIWERWGRLKSISPSPSLWGAVILSVGLVFLVVGIIGAELYTQRASLIIVLSGLVLLIGGKQFLLHLSLPIAFLIFMIPLPAIVVNTIAFPLQIFAAQTAAFCLFNLGIPVLREGNLISLAGSTLEVAEACSGLRSLLALLTLGAVYGYFSQKVIWKRWLLIGLSIPIAIVANALRVTGTGILANNWGVEAAQGFYHTFEGWLVFVVAFILLFCCGFILAHLGKEKLKDRSSFVKP